MNIVSRCLVLLFLAITMTGCVALRGAPDPPRTTDAAQKDPGYLISSSDLKRYNDEGNAEEKKLFEMRLSMKGF